MLKVRSICVTAIEIVVGLDNFTELIGISPTGKATVFLELSLIYLNKQLAVLFQKILFVINAI
jgi:hypothetical protein